MHIHTPQNQSQCFVFYFHCINYIQKHAANQIAIIFYAVGFGISTCSDLDDLKYTWYLWKYSKCKELVFYLALWFIKIGVLPEQS